MERTPPLLAGRTAVVTGSSRGIGLGIARVFGEAGATVVLSARNAEQLQEAAEGLRADGISALSHPCDVTREDDVADLVAYCQRECGRLDVMVNNAGATRDATMRNLSYDDWRAVLDVHLSGAWLGCRAAAGVMREQGAGSIINISSIAGKVGNVGQTNYAAAKAGLTGLTKSAAKELAHLGVRVNAVQPGLTMTAMTAGMRPDLLERKLAAIPMGRAADPREIALATLFLASDMSSYITGVVLEVTGGRDM